MSLSLADRGVQYKAILGDLRHKLDVYRFRNDFGKPEVEGLFTNQRQAWYLRVYYPDLVPPPNGGQPPSDHSVATVFEYYYNEDFKFRVDYLGKLKDEAV